MRQNNLGIRKSNETKGMLYTYIKKCGVGVRAGELGRGSSAPELGFEDRWAELKEANEHGDKAAPGNS